MPFIVSWPRGRPRLLAGLVAALLMLPTPLAAHGVAAGDAGYIQEISGIHLLPFVYLGAKHMVTGYDHLLFLFGVVFFLYPAERVRAMPSRDDQTRNPTMNRRGLSVLALGSVLLVAPAQRGVASEIIAGPLHIVSPWTRAVGDRAPTAAGYMTIRNGGQVDDRLPEPALLHISFSLGSCRLRSGGDLPSHQ